METGRDAMGATGVLESPPDAADPPRRKRSLLPTSAEGWLMMAAGLGLIGYGVWRIVDRGGSVIGLILMFVGVILMPYRFVRLAGGLGLAGVGVYMLVKGFHLQGAIVTVLGVVTLAEAIGRKSD